MENHPGPWRYEDGRFLDANGVGLTGPEPMRLMLAAPELLEVLKCMVLARRDNGDESKGLESAEELIARVEGR